MINNFARRCGPIARNVRTMASQDLEAESARWKKLSFGMMGFSSLFFAFTFLSGHEHHEHRTDYPYMNIRTKGFPWKCSDCNLFNRACFKACKEAEEAEAAEAAEEH